MISAAQMHRTELHFEQLWRTAWNPEPEAENSAPRWSNRETGTSIYPGSATSGYLTSTRYLIVIWFSHHKMGREEG